jgi:ABC-type glycerol-3-phosphate transport system substrate-binding protein
MMFSVWRSVKRICLTACLLTVSAACSALPGIFPPAPTPVQTPVALPPTPTPTAPAAIVNTLHPPQDLTIWLPPEFDPSGSDPAADLLRARLDEFSQANGIQVRVRIKAASGQGGLLESLSAAGAAAPLAMPGVIALPRPDLETAALKGLLVPLDGVTAELNNADWYDYAHQLALVQGATFGLPFAGDALVVVYRPEKISVPPVSWDAILRSNQPMAFPAASQLALTPILLYQSIDGEIEDAQRRPILQNEELTQVFTLLRQAADRGVFPTWLSQYDNDAQVYQIYQDGQVNAVITWSSYYLSAPPQDSTIIPLPALSGKVTSLAGGWVWSVVDPLPERRALSIKLVEWLVDPKFLAKWTEAAGYLPTRPSALADWNNQNLKAVFGQVALAARPRPSSDLVSSLGPVLREAVLKVIRLEADPQSAAAAAVARLSNPTPRP